MNSALYVLNFYSPVFVDQLRSGRKTATIRLGDKSRKYKRGQVVWITIGYRHQPREKIFAAVIDDVEVKKVAELPPRGDGRLPRQDLHPSDLRRGHGHRHPVLADRRTALHPVREWRNAIPQLTPPARRA